MDIFRKKRKLTPLLLVLPSCIFIGVLFCSLIFLFPLSLHESGGVGEIKSGVTLFQYYRFIKDSHYLSYITLSFRVSLLATLAALLLGYPMAYLLHRTSVRLRRILTLLLLMQFLSNYVMRMYALMLVLGNNGAINRNLLDVGVLDKPIRLMYNEFGVGVGLVVGSLAFIVFPIQSCLSNIDRSLEEAAQSLKANKIYTFWKITFPLSLPGVAAGVVLAFLFNLSAYVTPTILGGGHFNMIANFIFQRILEVFDYPLGSAAAFLLLGLAYMIVFSINKAFKVFVKGTTAK